MNKRFLFPCLFILSILGGTFSIDPLAARASSLTDGKTLVLYDASSGAVPSEALLQFTDFPPGAASVAFSGDATTLDTTPSGSDPFAGWTSSQSTTTGFPVLDRTAGIQVDFTLQMESESHARDNRCGFSFILLDRDAKGIELCFWENEIWVQNDGNTGGLFTHGESAAFSTTSGLTDYKVTFVGDTYTVTANSQPLLSGPVRDYSAFDGFPDPYETPDFLFLGDDTRSASSRIRLRYLSITGTDPNPVATLSSPVPTAVFTPAPAVTLAPSPSPAPTGGIPGICSSGWLFIAVVLGSLRTKKSRR